MTRTETTIQRTQRAVAVCDAALVLLARYGSFEDTNVGPVLTAQVKDFQFLYWRPDQRVACNGIYRSDPTSGPPEGWRQYGLDAWYDRRKVLSMVWKDFTMPRLFLFRKGDWEARLCRLSGLDPESLNSSDLAQGDGAPARDRPAMPRSPSMALH